MLFAAAGKAGEFFRYAGIKICAELRVGLHDLGHRVFRHGIHQRLLFHDKLMRAAAFHQRARFESIALVIKRDHFAVAADFFNQPFDHDIKMLNRLLRLDDNFIVVEKSDVHRALQSGALMRAEAVVRRIAEVESFHGFSFVADIIIGYFEWLEVL